MSYLTEEWLPVDPSLLNIFISNLCPGISCIFMKFLDATKLWSIANTEGSQVITQEDLDNLVE